MDERTSDVWVWIAVLAFLILVPALVMALMLSDATSWSAEIALNDLAQSIRAGQIRTVIIRDNGGEAWTTDDAVLQFHIDRRTDLLHALSAYGVSADDLRQTEIKVAEPQASDAWLARIAVWLPPSIMGLALVLLMRNSQPREIMQLRQRSARTFASSTRRPTRFADVAGVDEARSELVEVVEFLKDPEKFTALGARVPKGVLLVGPPGTGKTLLARAVAGEAGVPFLNISGSEFVEIVVGVGASRVRDLFAQARNEAPAIVFVDEIDAVARQRGAGLGPTDDEREQTLNQVLVEMDGFEPNTNVVVMAATNRPDILDPALLRPGRFDRRVMVGLPDMAGREAILGVHAAGKPLDVGVSLTVLARLTPGFSGADLANLINEGAILAARRGKKSIGVAELEEATERVLGGPARDGGALSQEARLVQAYREAGRAVVMHHVPEHDAVHSVSIVRRGLSFGSTRALPDVEHVYETRPRLEALLTACLAGMAAEELLLHQTTSLGAADLRAATSLARDMVERYGMSERLGPVALDPAHRSDRSGQTIDAEIREVLEHAHARAATILVARHATVERLAEALMESETMSGLALTDLLEGCQSSSSRPRVTANTAACVRSEAPSLASKRPT